MFELSNISPDAPLAFIALAVLHNLCLKAINLYDSRKRDREEAATHERIVELTKQLSRAQAELDFLREEVADLKRKGA